MRRIALPLIAAALTAAVGATPALASTSIVRVGVADNFSTTFQDPSFERLKVKRTRYVIPWNAVDEPARLVAADQFMAAADRANVDVLLHFSTDNYAPREGHLPSRSEYRRKVGALVERYWAHGVREYGVWNEANDRTQPTYRSPRRAAEFFQELWRMLDDRDRCGSALTAKCRVIALDVLDGRTKSQRASTRSYIRRFYRSLGPTYRTRGRFVGLHNYSDTNRNSTGGTTNVLREVRRYNKRPVVWLTETGGVVKLGDTGDFRCNPDSPSSVRSAERRADRAVTWMFRLAKRFRRDVDRLYIYQYTGADCRERFDAGLVRRDRSRRPAWYEVFRQLRDSKIVKR